MNREKMKKIFNEKIKIIFIVFILICFIALFFLIKKDSTSFGDTISYQGNTYVYLEYNHDIFTYYYNSNDYYEVDVIYPIPHDRWDMIYSEGDLFVLKNQIKDAKSYYGNDNNYKWTFVLDYNDSEIELPIYVSKEELKYLYNMENMKKEETMLFDDIERFGTLKKTSKDNFISSIITLAYYKDSWYWRTETIDDSKEGDPEYVIELPKTLSEKISILVNDLEK